MTPVPDLEAAVRATLAAARETIREVKMFGGTGFMLNGNLLAAVSRRGLLLRVGRERHAAALARPGARIVEMQGRQMQGYVSIDPATLTKSALGAWLEEAAAFVRTLPPKIENARRERKTTGRKGARK